VLRTARFSSSRRLPEAGASLRRLRNHASPCAPSRRQRPCVVLHRIQRGAEHGRRLMCRLLRRVCLNVGRSVQSAHGAERLQLPLHCRLFAVGCICRHRGRSAEQRSLALGVWIRGKRRCILSASLSGSSGGAEGAESRSSQGERAEPQRQRCQKRSDTLWPRRSIRLCSSRHTLRRCSARATEALRVCKHGSRVS
jgi:hypothetical protein